MYFKQFVSLKVKLSLARKARPRSSTHGATWTST